MKLVINPHLYFIEEIDEIESFEELADLLGCFVSPGETLLFSCLENNWANRDQNAKVFIKERTVFTNNEWVQPFEPLGRVETQLWYRATGRDEIIQALKIDQYCLCVVLKDGSDFDRLSMVLNVFEAAEFEVLHIEDRTKSQFQLMVLPRLRKLLGERLEVTYLER